MDSAILVSIISAIATISAVIFQTKASNREIQSKLETQQAVIETKLDNIKQEQVQQGQRIDAHNHFNERITKIETILEVRRHEDP